MPQQLTVAVENNFTKGLITEATGLNFPENAATDCDNCEFTLIGDVTRRLGINIEPNGVGLSSVPIVAGQSTYVWNNPGGNGDAKLLVRQIGNVLYFYDISAVTTTLPLSSRRLGTTVDMTQYGSPTADSTQECTFADGNGYLFVYNQSVNPFWVYYNSGNITSGGIAIYTRDFAGTNDGLAVNTRTNIGSVQHFYNLQNQGWITGQPWAATSSISYVIGTTGVVAWTVAPGITGIVAGQKVSITYNGPGYGGGFGLPPPGTVVATGTVSSYAGNILQINVTYAISGYSLVSSNGPWAINPISVGFIDTFLSAAGVYPSNSDVWWFFKDNTGAFSPSTTLANVNYTTGLAPRGHYIMNEFYQDRTAISGNVGITPAITYVRPTTGAWFQGRVWYTGVNASFPSSGDIPTFTWTENIYFSQVVQTPNDFGSCYQVNDPTSETLNGLLPTDGGVIKIVGAGRIHKLFPIANGLLVFANNGIWFITGSTGIGFTANDYTLTQISKVKILSPYSFVDVNGLPMFWNEEGIYQVSSSQNGSLTVEPLTVGTILTYYSNIPVASKYYARGDYDPVNYVVQWTFRSTQETGLGDRYIFDRMLNYNTYNKAFYPYSIALGPLQEGISGINYISYPTVTSSTPDPGFIYPFAYINGISFAKEYDDNLVDWGSANYDSYFVTGYKIRGQGIKKFQPQYIQIWNRTNGDKLAYSLKGIWDYAASANSGRFTSKQIAIINDANYGVVHKRHKIRGRGYSLQFKVTSKDGWPFDVIGWSVIDMANAGA